MSPRRGAIRARQRSRTRLLAFSDPLVPVFEEIGIDQLQVRVRADFRSSVVGGGATDYLEVISTADPDIDWFKLPSGRGRSLTIQTRSNPNSTIKAKITAIAVSDAHATVQFAYHCNPTRTLAHALHMLDDDMDVAGALARMSPVRFFTAVSDMPLSLNNDTNWVADINRVKTIFGEDVFSAYLPIYVSQLRQLTSQLLAPYHGVEAVEDGDADVMSSTLGVVRVDWRGATAPQAEAYFERHHSGAQAVVRSAAQNALDKLDDTTVRRHLGDNAFERDGAWFSMRCGLPNDLTLSMYAKAPTRLRFEISRKKAGRYDEPVQSGASGRLLSILTSERRRLLTACDWRAVSALYAEHTVPVPGDLIEMISAVEAACEATGHQFRPVVSSLLIDAGISRTTANSELIAALEARGIIDRTSLRRRDTHRLPRRYALREPYLAAQRATLTAMSGSDVEGDNVG